MVHTRKQPHHIDGRVDRGFSKNRTSTTIDRQSSRCRNDSPPVFFNNRSRGTRRGNRSAYGRRLAEISASMTPSRVDRSPPGNDRSIFQEWSNVPRVYSTTDSIDPSVFFLEREDTVYVGPDTRPRIFAKINTTGNTWPNSVPSIYKTGPKVR